LGAFLHTFPARCARSARRDPRRQRTAPVTGYGGFHEEKCLRCCRAEPLPHRRSCYTCPGSEPDYLGTELHLVLQNKLTTATAHNGDRFFAIVADPVYVNSMLVIPAGTKVNGIVGAVITPKHFPLFRGESAMSLSFRSIQIADREIPIPMSIVSVKKPAWHNNGTSRHDIKLEEGQILEEKADVKGYVLDAAIGTGGGSLAGLVFSTLCAASDSEWRAARSTSSSAKART